MRSGTASTTRWLIPIGISAVVIALVVWPSSDHAIHTTLTRAADALKHNPAEVEKELESVLTPDVRVEIPGLGVATGRAAVISRALAVSDGKRPVIQVEHVEVQINDATHANARFDAIVSDSQAGDLHADARRVRAELVKRDGAWRIKSLAVTPEERAEPEARP